MRATREGKDFLVHAKKGVVLATGGYDWHPELPKYFEQLPEWYSMCQPTVAGDGFMLGSEVGAAIAAVPPSNLGLMFGYHIPGEEQEGKKLYRGSWDGGFPHAIWVNSAGKRFGDESFYKDYLPKAHDWDGVKQSQPNFPPYLDLRFAVPREVSARRFLPSQDLPESLVQRAPTRCASWRRKLGVDADGLGGDGGALQRFAEEGVDRDFGRGTYPWAGMMTGDRRTARQSQPRPADKPPFYGLRLHVVARRHQRRRPETNADAQVMHVRGRADPRPLRRRQRRRARSTSAPATRAASPTCAGSSHGWLARPLTPRATAKGSDATCRGSDRSEAATSRSTCWSSAPAAPA